MRWMNIFRLRLRSLLARGKVESELEEELRYHLERQIDLYVAAGMSVEDARHAALRSIGGLEQAKEGCRDMRGLNFFQFGGSGCTQRMHCSRDLDHNSDLLTANLAERL